MAKISKYFLYGNQNLSNFSLQYSNLKLQDSLIQLMGTEHIDTVVVGRGFNFDFTDARGGIDEIYILGLLSNFSFAKSDNNLMILAANTSIKVNPGDKLIFYDGVVLSSDLIHHPRVQPFDSNPSGTTLSAEELGIVGPALNLLYLPIYSPSIANYMLMLNPMRASCSDK